MTSRLAVLAVTAAFATSCQSETPSSISGQDIEVTFIHTTDIHSRLVPYDLQVGEVDARLGLSQNLEPLAVQRASPT